MSTASAIAANLEATFAHCGFAEPGVAALRAASGVTLRTLYRHFPSREAMVVGALASRHDRYLERLAALLEDTSGTDAVLCLFDRVADWMASEAATGCLFAQASVAHPGSHAIGREVERYRTAVRDLIAARISAALPNATDDDRAQATDALFVLHEGQVQASVRIGAERARVAARSAAEPLLALLQP